MQVPPSNDHYALKIGLSMVELQGTKVTFSVSVSFLLLVLENFFGNVPHG